MSLLRALVATLVVAVVVLGPAPFIASSPCFECDGVCGAAATFAAIEIRNVVLIIPLTSESAAQVPATPVLLSELPPRPLFTTA